MHLVHLILYPISNKKQDPNPIHSLTFLQFGIYTIGYGYLHIQININLFIFIWIYK